MATVNKENLKGPAILHQTRSKKDNNANNPIILSDDEDDEEEEDDKDGKDSIDSCQKKVDEKPPCEECGITKENILKLLHPLLDHLPPDPPSSEKSMEVLELKLHLRGVHDHVLNPFSTATKLSTISENQACNKCGIDKTYLLALLALARVHLTNDESLFDKCMGGKNNKRNDGNDATKEQWDAFMLRVYLGAITGFVKNPGGTDDHTSEDDDE